MVKKGKKKKKSKTKVADPSAGGSADELNIEGDGAQLGIGKKKKPKKKKLTKEEKEAAKLAKKLASFQEDEVGYTKFWHKMHKWMQDNADAAIATFKLLDHEEDGCVPFPVFKAGMRDLDCPVTEMELYALSRIIDPEDTGGIDYTNFKAGMRQPLPPLDSDDDEKETDRLPEDYKPEVMSAREKIAFQIFGDPYHTKYPRYICIDLKLKDFVMVAKHPGHFQLVAQSHLTVRGLINKISETTEITSGQLRVYAGKDCRQEECLHPRLTLEDCGFEGGSQWEPQRGTLFYDYFVEYDDCPLLNCDFYFGNYAKPRHPVLKAAYPDYEERLRRKHRRKVNDSDDDL